MSDTELDYTTTPCGKCGLAPQEPNQMVGCDCCKKWYHFTCVGVTAATIAKQKKWYCAEADCQKAAQEYQKKKKTRPGKPPGPPGEESDASSVRSAAGKILSAEERMKAMQEEQRLLELEWESEKLIQEKRIELQNALKKKKLQEQRELRERQRLLDLDLEYETRELEFEEKSREFEIKLKARQDHLKRMQELESSFKGQLSIVDKQLAEMKLGAAAGGSKVIGMESTPLRQPGVKKHNRIPPADDDDDNEEESEESESSDDESDQKPEEKTDPEETIPENKTTPVKIAKKTAVVPDGLERKRSGPTKAQLAARHGINKHLLPFSGKPEDWPLFFAAFTSSTEACGYSDVDNLARLQQCLKGNALELVRGQLLLPKSVPRVIEKLRQHFGRPEQLLRSFLDRVEKLEQPKNLRGFIPFSNVVEQLCEHLEAAKMKQHLKNPLLIESLVKKLPDLEKRQWVEVKRQQGKKCITLRTLTDFLARIAEDACETGVDINFSAESKASAGQSSRDGKQSGRMYHHSEADDANDSDSSTRKWNPCMACQRTGHGLRFCYKFKEMPYADRAELVSRERLCKVCLNGHGGQCKMKIRCDVEDCEEAHNSLMHPVDTDAIGLSAHIRTGNEVLFRIVPVQLHCGESTIEVLAFLDEGASVTLIESKLADRLNLDGVEEKLTIKWTGSVSRVESRSRRMNVWASAVGGKKILLNTVRTVGQLLLPRQKLDAEELAAQYQHLRGLPITSYDGQPEMIIGLNNIHAFAPMETRAGKYMDEPIAVRCPLGWTTYGPRQCDTSVTNSYLGYHCEERQLQSDYRLPKRTVDVRKDEPTATPEVATTAALRESVAVKRRLVNAVETRNEATPATAVGSIKAEQSAQHKVSPRQKVKLLTRMQLSKEKPGRFMTTVQHDLLKKIGADEKGELHRSCSQRKVERADSAASAGSVSSGLEPSKLPVDEKVQPLDSEAKLTTGRISRAEGERAWKLDGKSGDSVRRPDVTGWSMLPRPNGLFEPPAITPRAAASHHRSAVTLRQRRLFSRGGTVALSSRTKTNAEKSKTIL